jgi:hypothetical protein
MANIIGPDKANLPNIGDSGNASSHYGGYTLAGAAIATTVEILTIPAGSVILDSMLVNAALGASTTVSLGYKNKDGSAGGSATALLAAGSTSAAGVARGAAAPIAVEKDVIVYATVGGGVATGRIDAVVDFLFRGVA